MNAAATKLGTAAVSLGIVAAGISVGRRSTPRRLPYATIGAVGLAAGYLAGTYGQRSRIFGRVATPVMRPGDRILALTFDDGPDPRHTLSIAELLSARGHTATFFTLGEAARDHPDVVRSIATLGHEIACHGNDHRLLGFALPRSIDRQLDGWESAVEAALGRPGTRLLRTPHGVRSPWLVAVARRRGYAVCGWNGSVFDTAEPGVETIVRRVLGLLRPGAVVLLHDGDGARRGASRSQTVTALGPILDAMDVRGLRSVELSALL